MFYRSCGCPWGFFYMSPANNLNCIFPCSICPFLFFSVSEKVFLSHSSFMFVLYRICVQAKRKIVERKRERREEKERVSYDEKLGKTAVHSAIDIRESVHGGKVTQPSTDLARGCSASAITGAKTDCCRYSSYDYILIINVLVQTEW